MKKITKCIVGAVVVIALIVGGLVYLSGLTERKNSYEKYADFFEQEEDFDVLFFGTSHVINGIYPMELWETYGIVSYNFGGHSNMLATTYWVVKNALEYTSPKLVVIDCHSLESDKKTYSLEYLHISFDAFPLTDTKLDAITDLLDDNSERLSMIWNFSTYHSRWLELTEDDFNPEPKTTKGAETRVNVAEPQYVTYIDRSQKLEEETVSVEYLRKTIEECQEQGIEVLLTWVPYPPTEEQQMAANYVFDIAEEYGVNYLDLYTLTEQVDFSIDCYDEYSHLNASGAKKITNYIGQYIMDNYDIEDQRDSEEYADWYEDYDEYKVTKVEHLENQTVLEDFLVLLYDQSFSSCIYLSRAVIEDTTEWNLYKNIDIPDDMLLDDEPRLIFVNTLDGSCESIHIGEEMENDMAKISISEGENGYLLTVNGDTEYEISRSEYAAFLVFDNDTKEVVVEKHKLSSY